eukprot:596934-Amorphochlora_amoeboformis.AAC.2
MDDSEGDPKIDQVEKYHGVNIEFDDKGYPRPSPEDLGKLNEPLFYDPIDKELGFISDHYFSDFHEHSFVKISISLNRARFVGDKKWEPLVDKVIL